MPQEPSFYAPRKDYSCNQLCLEDLCADPFAQFAKWLKDAENWGIIEPNAMALATASKTGKPSCRMVLLKGVDDKGFLFFTNYNSRKGQELAESPYASLIFYWRELERQVCIEGIVERTSRETSEAYFHRRPRQSQLGAHASPQGKIIASRKELEDELIRLDDLYKGKEIPLPSYWGGYRVIPNEIEFWQGRESRLHDRFRYIQKNSHWNIVRLAS